MQETPHQRYLGRAEAAQYIQSRYGFSCSRQWLAKLAVLGGGPIFRKAGRNLIYAPADLDDWAMTRIGEPQRSTSDVPSNASAPSEG
jgi:hypothetical protein